MGNIINERIKKIRDLMKKTQYVYLFDTNVGFSQF